MREDNLIRFWTTQEKSAATNYPEFRSDEEVAL